MRAASTVVQELLARLFPYRLEKNRAFARTTFELLSAHEEHIAEDAYPRMGLSILAMGLNTPLLGLPFLEESP
jgi:hypothetical protein